jgi:hypothetical protein
LVFLYFNYLLKKFIGGVKMAKKKKKEEEQPQPQTQQAPSQ